MARHFFTSEIGLYIRDQVKPAMETFLGSPDRLKRCMLGTLTMFASEKDFVTRWLPSIYIKPLGVPEVTLLSLYEHYETAYTFRITFVTGVKKDLVDDNDYHEKDIVEGLEAICDSLIENISLASPTPIAGLDQGQILRVEIGSIDLDPPENSIFQNGLHADALVGAVNARIVVAMWR